jgi:lipopolysaccharide export LptBFGC system permease protein LptF
MCTPDSLDKLNALISQASDTISCDANCQQQRKADQLKQKYLDAQTNLASAPNQLNAAQKNYLVFTQGLGGYNDANESELQAKAQAIADAFEQNFYDQETAVNTQIDTYDGLRLNYENIFDLYKKYKVENKELLKDLKDDTNDVLTNERKTYYEDQRIDGLKFYYYYFLVTIYVVCVICFAAFSFIYPSQSSVSARVATLIGLIALPFVSSWILGNVIALVYKAYNLLPKNVYR